MCCFLRLRCSLTTVTCFSCVTVVTHFLFGVKNMLGTDINGRLVPVKTFIHITNVGDYASYFFDDIEEEEELSALFKFIHKSVKPKEKLLTWKGYYAFASDKEGEKHTTMALSAFVLTKKALYVSCRPNEKMLLTKLTFDKDRYLMYDKLTYEPGVDSFVICGKPIIYFLYDSDEVFTETLIKHLRELGVISIDETFNQLLGRLYRR